MARSATTRTVAKTATRKPAKTYSATITHGPEGTVIVGAPYIVPGHGAVRFYLKPHGWEYNRTMGAHVDTQSVGRPMADLARVNDAAQILRDMGVTVSIQLTTTGKGRRGKPAPVATAPAPVKASGRKTTRKPAPVNPLADVLRGLGLPEVVIAAALAAATGEATAVTATAPAPVKTARKTAPATPFASIEATGDGRAYTLPAGTRARAMAKLVRRAIEANKRAGGVCTGGVWHVTVNRDANTFTVTREDGAPVVADVDAIVAGAIG